MTDKIDLMKFFNCLWLLQLGLDSLAGDWLAGSRFDEAVGST